MSSRSLCRVVIVDLFFHKNYRSLFDNSFYNRFLLFTALVVYEKNWMFGLKDTKTSNFNVTARVYNELCEICNIADFILKFNLNCYIMVVLDGVV